jgi:hypothetical protein
MAGFWGARKQEREQLAAQDAELGRRADAALVADRRAAAHAEDELAFAEIELGTEPTRPPRRAHGRPQHMGEAFQLNQLNHDDIPDTPKRLRTRNARIIQLCDWAEDLLDDRLRPSPSPSSAPAARRRSSTASAPTSCGHAAHPAPRRLARVHAHAPDALRKIEKNAAEAAQLLEFATHGADVSTARRENGQREQANLALETAIEAGAARRPCSTPSTRSRSRRCAPNRRWMPSSRIRATTSRPRATCAVPPSPPR